VRHISTSFREFLDEFNMSDLKSAGEFLDPARAFGVAERAVKQMIFSYFEQFSGNNIHNAAKKVGVAYFRIPEEYTREAESIRALKTLPASFVNSNSLTYIPTREEPIECKKLVREEGGVRVETYGLLVEAREDAHLGTGTGSDTNCPIQVGDPQIKRGITAALNGAIAVFYSLKIKYPLLGKINLVPDFENFRVYLVDENFPGFRHSTFLTYAVLQQSVN
jgi:hypothetical protein